MKAYAIIMAGGNGERFWPLSTAKRPKQFVSIFGGKPLIRHAVDRLAGLIPPERTLVITARRLVALTRRALPTVPRENIIGEPCRRDTAAAVAVACGLVKRLGGADAIGCILTADQLIEPAAAFRQVLKDAITAANKTSSIVTVGIEPDCPATGFGYVELGEALPLGTKTAVSKVKRFVEKPNLRTATRYLASGRFKWNSGMFIWRADAMERAFREAAPQHAALIVELSAGRTPSAVLRRLYPSLQAISVDYAVMEKTRDILVVNGCFKWDDVGSWTALPRHFASDGEGNTRLGKTALLETHDSIVVSEGDHVTALVGLKDVVVVHTKNATLVCAKDRVQEVKTLVRKACLG